jgi:HTH-type transcriptional regulator/antitoxin HigA
MNNEEDDFLKEIYSHLSSKSKPTLVELIERRKEELKISGDINLAKAVGLDRNTLKRIVNGENEKADVLSLLKISQFLGVDISETVKVYVDSLKPGAKDELNDVKKSTYILKTFDLQGLKQQGFLTSATDFKYIENRIVKFFGLDSIFHYSSEVGHALFSRANLKSHDQMRNIWVRGAYFQFKKLNNPNDYDPSKLEELLPRIRPYTRHVKAGFLTVLKALYNIGITVIVQDYFSKTAVYGASFVVNNKPCVVITSRNNKYAILWHSLLHELYHVYYDFNELKSKTYHISGEDDVLLMREDDANLFASELLFPKVKLEQVAYYIKSNISIEKFAEVNNVHPSIIYNSYCRLKAEQGEKVYQFYSKYLIDASEAIKLIKSNPWNKETLMEEIESIKLKLESIHN